MPLDLEGVDPTVVMRKPHGVYRARRVGLSGKWYYSHCYWGSGVNHTQGSDASQQATHGGHHRRETAFPAGESAGKFWQ